MVERTVLHVEDAVDEIEAAETEYGCRGGSKRDDAVLARVRERHQEQNANGVEQPLARLLVAVELGAEGAIVV